MINLPYFEDLILIYSEYIYTTLFPKVGNFKNKFYLYSLSVLHILGTIMIILGIFFPPNYMPIYLIYLLLIIFSYVIFNGHCFMTLLSNKYSGLTRYPLHIRMSTARKLLLINIILTLIAIYNKDLSIYNILSKKIFV